MRHISKLGWLILIIIAVLAFGAWRYTRPIPKIEPVNEVITVPKTTAASIPWPSGGQAALGAAGYGVLATHNTSSPQPIASIAKIITALAVLRQKPLIAGQPGPQITLDATDQDYFNYYFTHDGSVANIANGEQISEYQMLEAMLIPSANNIADSLARWAFGSTQSYITYANQMVKTMGLSHTTVGNTNGFDDTTTSTADDLVLLGLKALQDPVIASIVSQSSAQIPVQGTVKNVNYLLGSNGVFGIKTGNTDKAGGCYLFAAKRQVAGQQVAVVGAVLGAQDLSTAISATPSLLDAADTGFTEVKVISKGQTLALYKAPWGSSVQVKSDKDLSLLVWKGQPVQIKDNFEAVNTPITARASVGSVSVKNAGKSVISSGYLAQTLPSPNARWRILHR